MKSASTHVIGRSSSDRITGAVLAFLLMVLVFGWGAGAAQAQTGGSELDTAKRVAIQQIAQRGPPLIKVIQERYATSQNRRLYLLDIAALGLIPLAGFVGFALYPRLARKTVASRTPNADQKQLTRLYLIQGLVAAVVLFGQGFCLWLLQLGLTTLANFTNPQIVLQERAISYVVDNREKLVDRYSDLFIKVAQNFDADPDLTIFANLINNTRQLRDDPFLNFGANAVNFLQPVLSNLLVITLLLLLFFFLRRLWPDLKKMFHYPLDLISSEPGPTLNTRLQTGKIWASGRKLIVAEIKVILCFAILVIGLALLTALFLQIFFSPVVGLLIDFITFALAYFARFNGASGMVVIACLLLVLFLVECVLIFLLAFSFLTGKVLGGLRNLFVDKFNWTQTRRFITRNVLRFLEVIALLAVTGIVLTTIAQFLLPDFSKNENQNWMLILLGVPLLLLIGLNLIMALAKGFKTLFRLFKNTEALDIVTATATAGSG